MTRKVSKWQDISFTTITANYIKLLKTAPETVIKYLQKCMFWMEKHAEQASW